MDQVNERRSSERFATLNFVHYKLEGCDEGNLEDMGRTMDASELGLLMQTRVPLPVGQHITLSIGLAENILDLSGEVVHCVEDETEEGMSLSGIEFGDLDQQQLSKLTIFLTAFAATKK